MPPLGSVDTGYSSPFTPSHAEPPALPPGKPHATLSGGPGVKAGRGCPSPLPGWASFHSSPPLSPPQNRRRAGSMGYLCVTAPSLAGVKEQAGGRLRSRERQELQGEEQGGTCIACSSAAPSPLARVACLCAHAWEHQQVLPCSGRGSGLLGSRSGLLGGGRAILFLLKPLHCTHHHKARPKHGAHWLFLRGLQHIPPTSMPLPLPHHWVKPCNLSTECLGAPLPREHVPPCSATL